MEFTRRNFVQVLIAAALAPRKSMGDLISTAAPLPIPRHEPIQVPRSLFVSFENARWGRVTCKNWVLNSQGIFTNQDPIVLDPLQPSEVRFRHRSSYDPSFNRLKILIQDSEKIWLHAWMEVENTFDPSHLGWYPGQLLIRPETLDSVFKGPADLGDYVSQQRDFSHRDFSHIVRTPRPNEYVDLSGFIRSKQFRPIEPVKRGTLEEEYRWIRAHHGSLPGIPAREAIRLARLRIQVYQENLELWKMSMVGYEKHLRYIEKCDLARMSSRYDVVLDKIASGQGF